MIMMQQNAALLTGTIAFTLLCFSQAATDDGMPHLESIRSDDSSNRTYSSSSFPSSLSTVVHCHEVTDNELVQALYVIHEVRQYNSIAHDTELAHDKKRELFETINLNKWLFTFENIINWHEWGYITMMKDEPSKKKSKKKSKPFSIVECMLDLFILLGIDPPATRLHRKVKKSDAVRIKLRRDELEADLALLHKKLISLLKERGITDLELPETCFTTPKDKQPDQTKLEITHECFWLLKHIFTSLDCMGRLLTLGCDKPKIIRAQTLMMRASRSIVDSCLRYLDAKDKLEILVWSHELWFEWKTSEEKPLMKDLIRVLRHRIQNSVLDTEDDLDEILLFYMGKTANRIQKLYTKNHVFLKIPDSAVCLEIARWGDLHNELNQCLKEAKRKARVKREHFKRQDTVSYGEANEI